MNTTDKIKDLTLKNMIIIVTYIAFLILGLIYFKQIIGFFGKIFDIISPFIIGFVLAFILNIPMKLFIKKLPIKDEKKKKITAAILSLLLILIILILMIIVVLPQIIDNVKLLIENLPSNLKQLEAWLDYLLSEINISPDIVLKIEELQANLGNTILTKLTSWGPSIALGVSHITASIVNLFMGVVMAIYMLFSKDKLIRQTKKLGQAFLSEERYNKIHNVLCLTGVTFENFLAGQLTESLIIGILCYIGCILLDIPYASIAALVIGVTNIIPYFGPIIGAFISSVLILFVSPIKVVIFVIFSSILQQVESNLIYPYVVGNSVGLSALWVLFAVTVGGGLFGITGMIFGLPAFSVIYELLRRWTNQRLNEKKKLKTKTEVL